jgi:hypothetical protein
MNINILGVILATVIQFIIGAIWYMPLFGKLWGRIHGFDKLDPAVQKEMAAKMGPWYGLQILVTLITSVVLAKLIVMVPNTSPYLLAVMAWIGFVVPAQASAVVFGGTEPKWILTKIAVMAGGSIACLMAGAAVLSMV